MGKGIQQSREEGRIKWGRGGLGAWGLGVSGRGRACYSDAEKEAFTMGEIVGLGWIERGVLNGKKLTNRAVNRCKNSKPIAPCRLCWWGVYFFISVCVPRSRRE